MGKYLFIVKPPLKKGEKIVSLILSNNKGEMVYTDWQDACDDERLLAGIKKMEELDKKLDKKLLRLKS